jgi:hypothetical protein
MTEYSRLDSSRGIKWGQEVPEDYFLNWSSSGHKDEWATVFCDDKAWFPAWEEPHPKNHLELCLKDAVFLLDYLLKWHGKKMMVTICQI